MKEKIRIGCGAGFSGDRLEPAVLLAEKGELDYLVLECLAERTIALAQKRKAQDPDKGYDILLKRRMELLLPILDKKRFRIITNMGAANPLAAAKEVINMAKVMGISIKVATVVGDDVYQLLIGEEIAMETNMPLLNSGKIISANAYMGADAILPALQSGADIIITGRVADPSLFVAPIAHEFRWDLDDPDLIGKGTVVGHLMECAGQVTGGYFADPIKKKVEGLDILGHPFIDVFQDGSSIISKVEETGGVINLDTLKEQLLYEVTDPNQYYTPDVIADFTSVKFTQLEVNKIKITGGGGKRKPTSFKVSIGYKTGFIGEGEISYIGSNAIQRAQLAGETISKRLCASFPELRIDYIGSSSPFSLNKDSNSYEVRLRVAGKADTAEKAAIIGEEVEALYTNGPAGGGGARKYVNEIVGIISTLISRDKVHPSIVIQKS